MQSVDQKCNVVMEPDTETPATRGAAVQLRQERSVLLLRLLWFHRRLVLRFVLTSMAVSTLIAFMIPKEYKATAQIMPPDNHSAALSALAGVANMTGGLGGIMGDIVGGQGGGAAFVGMLHSRTIADRLIKQFDLQKVYSSRYPEDVRKRLQGSTDISEDRKSGIISVTVTDKQPQRAAEMAQAYVTELDHLVADLSTSGARRERQFLEGRLQVVKHELEQSEVEFSQFSSKNTTLDIKEQGRAMIDAAARVQAELIATQTELQGLRQIYADNNVRVRSLQARVNELQRKLNQLGGRSAPEASESSPTNSSPDFSYPSIRQLPVLGVTYADLYRRMKTAELVYELLTREYEMAKVEEAKEIPTVKELDAPVVPIRKSFPPRGVLMVLGTLFGFSLAVAWVLGNQVWDEIDIHDPRKVLAKEIFASSRRHFRSWVKWRRVSPSGRIDMDIERDRT